MNNIIKRKWNQNSMVIIEDLQGMAFQAESGGHTFQISGIDGEGNTVALSGTPAGVMLRSDGQDVTLTCSVSEGVVSATLPANAYVVPGRFGLTIFLTSDGQKTAIYAAVGTVGKTSSGTVAPPAGSDVVTLVNQINTAIAAIPANYNACFAPAYSTSGLYSVGQYVTYNGNLYRCTTAITTAESWTAAHWTQTNLGADVYDLKSAIYNASFLSFTDNKWIDYAGAIYDSNLWALSNLIPVTAGYKVRIKTDIQENASICILNSNGTIITSIKGTSGIKNYDITVPDGGTQIQFSCYKSSKNQASVTPLYLSDSVIDALKSGSSIVTVNVKSDNVITGHLITKTGYVAESAAWDLSGFISVPSCDSITVNAYMYGTGAVVFYNANKEVVLGIDGNNASEYGGGNISSRSQIITISNANDIRFVRFCTQRAYVPITDLYVSYLAKWVDYANDLIANPDKGATYENKKVLVIGDSISTDAYGNYKKWVTNLIESGKFSLSNTTNSSQHATGFVARYSSQTPDDFITRLEGISNKNTYDLVIVFGGINDYIQNIPLGESGQDKTVYFKPAVDYFFQYLINNFTQARICVLLPLRTYNIWPNTAGNKQEVYSEYIHDVAKYYCLPVLNLTEESGFCPFIDSFKTKWTFVPSGYTDPDGVHPNAQYEKEYLAPMIWKFISGLID